MEAKLFQNNDLALQPLTVSVFWFKPRSPPPTTTKTATLENITKRIAQHIAPFEQITARADKKSTTMYRKHPPPLNPKVRFNNENSEHYSLVEIDTIDRSGLLYDLSQAFLNHTTLVQSAIIATYGQQVIDTFYLQTPRGEKITHSTQINRFD